MLRRWWCRINGGHSWITVEIHWWDWGGTLLWTRVHPASDRFNGIGCTHCGQAEWVQKAAIDTLEERDRD